MLMSAIEETNKESAVCYNSGFPTDMEARDIA
jgi:hypothetical protein